MLANYLIGLREGLEASLVVVILVAYLVKTDRRHLLPAIWLGTGAAIVVSLLGGALLTLGPRGLTFEAQEAIGGALSIAAVALVTWMLLWMARSARTLASDLKSAVDTALQSSPRALAFIAAVAVGREGLETALFLWAATNAATNDGAATWVPLLSAALGIATAVVIGVLLHRGVISLRLSTFFAATGVFLVFVAAGVLAYGIHDLQEAGILPGLGTLAFDVSHIIEPGSIIGTLLKGIFNFSPATTVLEAVAWTAYVAIVLPLFWRTLTTTRIAPARPSPTPTA